MIKFTKKNFIGLFILGVLFISGTLVRKNELYIGAKKFNVNEVRLEILKRKIFLDITSSSGIDHHHVRPPVDEILYRRIDSFFVSPGLAIADFDNDGFQDVFFPSTSPLVPNKLFINQKNKTFKEQSKQWEIDWNTNGKLAAATATAFDANNDGFIDLLLTGIGCTHLWINNKNKFILERKNQILDCKNALAGIPYDLDYDGDLDIYLLRYWGSHDMFNLTTPYIYVNNLYNANNGGENSVFINNGNGGFFDKTKIWGGNDGHWSYDAAFADFNDDGITDLYISNDYGPDQLFELGDKKLINRSDRFEVPDRRYGMNASLGDLHNDDKPSLFVSNAFEGPPFGLTGNFLWKFEDSRTTDLAREMNVMKCGFAWGASFVDWNVDGWTDLYVANGFISTKTMPDSVIPRYLEKEANIYNALQIRTLPGELSSDIRNWVSFSKDVGLHRKQRDCLFMNYDNKFMVDLAAYHNLDPLHGDNRAVGVLDLENDGDLDMIITSRNLPTTVLENITNPRPYQWIGIVLEPKFSHHSGTGSRITIYQNGQRQTRWNTGGRNGFLASSDIRHHFGLRETGNVNVIVRWPNGKITQVNDLEPGKYHRLNERDDGKKIY
jgi:hypothetical protein